MNENDLFLEVSSSNEVINKRNYYKDFFSKIFNRPGFIIPLFILTIIFTSGLLVDIFIDKSSYLEVDFEKAFISPNKVYWFGTSEFGQNFFYQVLIGTYNTIKLSFIASLINLFIGVVLGIIWGHNPKIDNLMIFIRNIFNNIPLPIFYIIVISAIGNGFIPMLFVVTFLGWVNIACLIRNNLIIIRNKEYNIYSKLNNVSPVKIAIYNYLPFLLSIVFNSLAISMPEITSIEVTLSYFGFSLGEGNISLGTLLHSSISNNNCFNHPYLFLIPLAFIFTINICFYYIGKTISNVSIKEDDVCLK